MANRTAVYLEVGRTWVFACALDWPGWARRGKGADAALEALAAYRERYAAVIGTGFRPGRFDVVEEGRGNATTDFGAPGTISAWDRKRITAKELKARTEILQACWQRFDQVVASAPAQLRKGPRGGGRDRDAIVDHVREAERGYAPKVGVRVPPRTPWADQRRILADTIQLGGQDGKWPPRFSVRRLAWHVLDHAWEIEDRGIDA